MKQKKKKRVFRVCTSGCHSYISYVDMWVCLIFTVSEFRIFQEKRENSFSLLNDLETTHNKTTRIENSIDPIKWPMFQLEESKLNRMDRCDWAKCDRFERYKRWRGLSFLRGNGF